MENFKVLGFRAALHGCDGPGLAGSESEASPANGDASAPAASSDAERAPRTDDDGGKGGGGKGHLKVVK